jgi:hypothetical protein
MTIYTRSIEIPSEIPCECGVDINEDKRIIGGHETDAHSIPWQVGLIAYNKDDTLNMTEIRRKPLCGGSIIGPKTILTAAHCVKHFQDNKMTVEVMVSGHDLFNHTDQARYIKSGCVPFGECAIWQMYHLANEPFGERTIWRKNHLANVPFGYYIKITRLKILPVLTREHYTSLLHWV